MNHAERVEGKFRELFKEQPLLVRSPGRVNLIGEHTDYNHGFVLPAAIDKAIYFAITPRDDNHCRVVALDMNDEYEFSSNNLLRSEKGWPNYIVGVVDQLVRRQLRIKGFNCVLGGDIPIGAGLSSSAAVEAGLAYALNALFDLRLDDLSLVKLAQKAENEFVGVQCGIMDQFANIFGEREEVLRLDCRSLEYEYYPVPVDAAIVLFDTGVSHSLASSEYNRRREDCNEGVAIVKRRHPSVTHLRDVTAEMLEESRQEMDQSVYRHCLYVVREIDRVLKACSALEINDLKAFGRYMFKTHDGLSRGYEVSCPELDFLVNTVRDDQSVYGARMMGGGFGGCTINLVNRSAVENVSSRVVEEYRKKFKKGPIVYVTSISPGTGIVNVHEQAKT